MLPGTPDGWNVSLTRFFHNDKIVLCKTVRQVLKCELIRR